MLIGFYPPKMTNYNDVSDAVFHVNQILTLHDSELSAHLILTLTYNSMRWVLAVSFCEMEQEFTEEQEDQVLHYLVSELFWLEFESGCLTHIMLNYCIIQCCTLLKPTNIYNFYKNCILLEIIICVPKISYGLVCNLSSYQLRLFNSIAVMSYMFLEKWINRFSFV